MLHLTRLGWDAAWQAAFAETGVEGEPGRVAVQHRGAYDVLTEAGEAQRRITNRLRRTSERTGLPVVGDWVALDAAGAIAAVLPRRTTISRRAAHEPASGVSREQVIAANVDVVLVVAALGQKLDTRLLERYLALALESGARPVVVLTKADLEPEPDAVAQAVADIGGDVPVRIVSAQTGLGLDTIRDVLGPGVTGALLGPSGVGKSTLVNALAADAQLATGEVSADGSGRHTTTRRELIALPGGGLVIDNPGMREVHLWLGDSGLLLVHQQALLALIDAWLTALPGVVFDDVLPLLRRIFARFAQPERRQIGERIKAGSVEQMQQHVAASAIDWQRAHALLPLFERIWGRSGALADRRVARR